MKTRFNCVKLLPLLLFVGFWLCGPVAAIVTVEVVFEQEQYVANESLPVGIRITNHSGRPLHLGGDPKWIEIAVDSDVGTIVEKYREPDVTQELFELPNAKRATRRLDISRCFDMGKPGSYRVSAVVHIPELELDVISPPAKVNIMSGTKRWQQVFALPKADPAAPGLGSVRRFELVQSMNQKQVKLYVRVVDQDGEKVLRIFPLGPVLTFSDPEALIDQLSRLHVLFQTSARTFSYSVVSPDGELISRQHYQYTDKRPVLRVYDDGAIKVMGGARVGHYQDFPVEVPLDETEASADTNAPSAAPAVPIATIPKPAEEPATPPVRQDQAPAGTPPKP